MRKKLAIMFASTLFAILCVGIIDRAVIRIWASETAIPRAQRFFYKTSEFTYTADINTLGFRDREFVAELGSITVAVLGDSFTYGWGVEEEHSWVKVLQYQLNTEGGVRPTLWNLGKPGGDPFSYFKTVVNLPPHLEPDVVLIAILQGDDLAQLRERSPEERHHLIGSSAPTEDSVPARSASIVRSLAHGVLTSVVPNTMTLRSHRRRTQAQSLTDIWKPQAIALYSAFSQEERERFRQLAPEIRKKFREGDLNPNLLNIAVTRPDWFLATWDLESPATKELIEVMSRCLIRVKKKCMGWGCKVIGVSVPYGVYVSRNDHLSRQRIGFELDASMLQGTNADDAIALACSKAGIPFFSVTAAFRRAANQESLFFPYDGHLNRRGHEVFASLLKTQIMDLLDAPESVGR